MCTHVGNPEVDAREAREQQPNKNSRKVSAILHLLIKSPCTVLLRISASLWRVISLCGPCPSRIRLPARWRPTWEILKSQSPSTCTMYSHYLLTSENLCRRDNEGKSPGTNAVSVQRRAPHQVLRAQPLGKSRIPAQAGSGVEHLLFVKAQKSDS